MSSIKSLKKKYFIILLSICVIASLSSIAPVYSYSVEDFPLFTVKNIHDSDILKSKNSQYAVVNLNEKITFSGSIVNTRSIEWNFGDKTKVKKTQPKKNTVAVTHTFKKVGTYNVTANLEGTRGINIVDEEYITVKVVRKPDLVLAKLNYARKGRDIIGFEATIKNKGAASSKACLMKMWYEDPKFKKYTKTAKIPALKAGKSTSVLINFEIPYKFRNKVQYAKVDSSNKISESIKSNNQKRLNDLITFK